MKVDIVGVLIDNVTKQEAIENIDRFVRSAKSAYIVTPYSEMIVFASKDPKYKKVLNQANLSLPDGIGILWAAKYLSLPLYTKYFILNTIQAFWQVICSGASLIFYPSYCRTVIQQRVTGSELVDDIAALAHEKNYSIALVGGFDSAAVEASIRLKQLFPNLKINLTIANKPFNGQTVEEIFQSNSDILLIAYSPPKQELWIAENLKNLNVKVAIGLGGTFDYLARKRIMAPRFMRSLGLEWLWRLVTQPWRIKRMWNAVPKFIWVVYRYKIKQLRNCEA